jgi:hypothetical protein
MSTLISLVMLSNFSLSPLSTARGQNIVKIGKSCRRSFVAAVRKFSAIEWMASSMEGISTRSIQILSPLPLQIMWASTL